MLADAGSSEIDIMEHYGSSGANAFGARPIKYNGGGWNSGDWQTYNHSIGSDLSTSTSTSWKSART